MCQAWYLNEGVMGGRMSTEAEWGFGYPASWVQALHVRQRNAALVAAWVRVRADIRAHRRMRSGAGSCLTAQAR